MSLTAHMRQQITLLAMIVCLGIASQAIDLERGPGFDPRPVEIPTLQEKAIRPITSMDLLTLRDLHRPQISPDGQYVAFVVSQAIYETNSYRTGLFVIGTKPGSTVVCLGTAGPPHWDEINEWDDNDVPQWSVDSKYIFYRMPVSGTWQIWRWNRETGDPVQVTHSQHDVETFDVTADRIQLALQIVEPTPKTPCETATYSFLFDWSFMPGLPQPLEHSIADATPKKTALWMHNLETGEEHKATEKELERYGPWKSDMGEQQFSSYSKSLVGNHLIDARTSPDGKRVAYTLYIDSPSEKERPTFRLYSKPIRGGIPVPLADGIYAGSRFWWSGAGKDIYYEESLADGHSDRLMAVDANGGTPRLLLQPHDHMMEYSVDRNGTATAAIVDSNTTPPQLAVANLTSDATHVLVDLNPEYTTLSLTRGRRMEVITHNGDKFRAYLVLPNDYKAGCKYPLIITAYHSDDGFLRGDIGDEYPIYVFAAEGFAVLSFNLGSEPNHRPGDFDSAVRRWAAPVDGMQTAIEQLTSMGIIDPAKVGVTGLSYAAEVVEYAISHTTLFAAAIDSGPGARDPFFFYLGKEYWHWRFKDWGLGGWPEAQPSAARWHMLSPALNADHILTPLLSNAPDSEYLGEMQLITSLKTLGKPVELMIYPNELHIKNHPKHRYEIYERNVDWFKFWLQDKKEEFNSGKTNQYQRWRNLRALQSR
jgi:dipeptidyl aminopeptidase/acylaminoacyl peptidase